jgi:hypothetical protein
VAAARKAIALELPAELAERLDAFWPAVGYRSRRAAITAAIEQMLAQHAASERRAAERAREPQPWMGRSPDTAAEAASRPITADLAREILG